MKKLWVLLFFPLAAFMVNDVYTQLQVSREEAKKRIFNAVISGNVYFPVAAKNVPVAERALLVSQMGILAKEYVSSPQFASDYQAWLKQEKDNLPIKDLDEVAAQYDKQQAELNAMSTPKMLEDQINALLPVVAYMPDAASKKQIQDQIDELKKQLEDTKHPGYVDPMKVSAQQASQFYTKEMAVDAAKQENEATLKHYEETHMQDPKELVRKRLQEFLTLSKSVDYAATTTLNKFGKQIFDNPSYQLKSPAWKQCYRAGREANEQAQAFVAQWLTEL